MSTPPTSTVPTAFGAGRAVLRRPGATALAVAYLLGWVPAGMAGIAVMLLVRGSGGGDALAGAVAGVFAMAAAAGAPLQVELARQRGPARVLLASAGAFALTFGALALAARSAAPAPTVLAWAVLAGLAVPPLPACAMAQARRLGGAPGPDRGAPPPGRDLGSGSQATPNGGPAARTGLPGGNGSPGAGGAFAANGGGSGADVEPVDHDQMLRELPPPRAARVGAPSPRALRSPQAVGPLLGSLVPAEPFAGKATGLWFVAEAAGQDRTPPAAARRAALGDGAWTGASAGMLSGLGALASADVPEGPARDVFGGRAAPAVPSGGTVEGGTVEGGPAGGRAAIPPPPSDALPPEQPPTDPLPPGPLLPDPPWLDAALGDGAAPVVRPASDAAPAARRPGALIRRPGRRSASGAGAEPARSRAISALPLDAVPAPSPAREPGGAARPALGGARPDVTDVPAAERGPGGDGSSGFPVPRLVGGTARALAVAAGPLLIGLLALVTSPLGAALGVALLCPIGVVGVVAWSPTGAWTLRGARGRLPLPASVTDGLRGRGMPPLLASTALGGVAVGALLLAAAAFAEGEGSPGAAGLLIAIWGAGGLAAGLWHASRAWAGPPRLVIAGCALAAAMVAPAVAIGLPQMSLALLLGGACLGPWLLCVTAGVDGRGLAEGAATWVFSALTGGVAVGAVLSGAAAALGGARPALAAAVLGAAGAALVSRIWRGTPLGPPAA